MKQTKIFLTPQTAFDHKKAKKDGVIVPSKGYYNTKVNFFFRHFVIIIVIKSVIFSYIIVRLCTKISIFSLCTDVLCVTQELTRTMTKLWKISEQ